MQPSVELHQNVCVVQNGCCMYDSDPCLVICSFLLEMKLCIPTRLNHKKAGVIKAARGSRFSADDRGTSSVSVQRRELKFSLTFASQEYDSKELTVAFDTARDEVSATLDYVLVDAHFILDRAESLMA